jgi:cytochrome c nitrite reductase small subunit
VMEDNYSAWLTSSHHTVATCNDCHAPHDLVGKYAIKATNGFFHSLVITVICRSVYQGYLGSRILRLQP